jgi:hypothetical protein
MAGAILGTWIKQTDHRIELESAVVLGNVRAQKLGQLYGLLIATLVLATGLAFMWRGHAKEGLGVITLDLAALVGVFVTGQRSQKRQVDGKRETAKATRNPRRNSN